MRVRFQQKARHAWRFAPAEPVVMHLPFLSLLAPAFLERFLVGGSQHSCAHFAVEIAALYEGVHVGVAGCHPQAIPAWHRCDGMLSAALGLREQELVVGLGSSKGLRRRDDLERRAIT